jgi:hypothetical protein
MYGGANRLLKGPFFHSRTAGVGAYATRIISNLVGRSGETDSARPHARAWRFSNRFVNRDCEGAGFDTGC